MTGTLLTLHVECPGYSVQALEPCDVERLQRLLERCVDYSVVVDGDAVSPTAADETLLDVPPGQSPDQKFVVGLVDGHGEIAGVLEGLRDYPDPGVWWVGLLLLAPETRQQGIGRRLLTAFANHVRSSGGRAIMLGVVADNRRALGFWREIGFTTVRTTEPRTFGKKIQTVQVMRRETHCGKAWVGSEPTSRDGEGPPLRPPVPRDYDALAGWVRDAVACARWAGPDLRFPFRVEELPALLAVSGSQSYCLGEAGAPLLAFGQYWVQAPGAVHLGRIIVSPQARGHGVGRRLCELLIAASLASTHATAVTLRVYRDNEAAVRLYASLGFMPLESECSPETLFLRYSAQGDR